ncbi:MAG: TolC family protein, partial [Magnetococcus sp. XQGC-1]
MTRAHHTARHGQHRWARGVGSLFGSVVSLVVTPAMAVGLTDAVSQALLNRPEISAAVHGTAAARERVGQAYAGFLPSINLRAAQGNEGSQNTSTQRSTKEYLWMERKDRTISLTQNLFDGFRTLNQVESNQAGARASAWRTIDAAEGLGMRAVEAYLTLLKARAQLIQSEKNWQAHEKLLLLAQQRAEYAVGSLAEVSQARSRVKRAEASVMQ